QSLSRYKILVLGLAFSFFPCSMESVVATEEYKQKALTSIENRSSDYENLAQKIWQLAEVGYQEVESSSLLQSELARAGFSIEAGVAGIPTAFVASYGQGRPVIGILAEYDALPGFSQDRVPERKPIIQDGAGHACGHHLLGTASTAAAIAVREVLADFNLPGTIRLYGTPAEEGGSGKVYMARAGLFDNVDAVLHWHPGNKNKVRHISNKANKSAKFRFFGRAAHTGSPHRGRSALDGVEAMNDMVNLLREHVPEETRFSYIITNGGTAPNVVPEFAEVYYYVRHPEISQLEQIWERVVATARGAALGTDTRMEYEVIHGNYNILPNETLVQVVDSNLRLVGGINYTQTEYQFAQAIRQSLEDSDLELGSESEIQPLEFIQAGSSTDVGDISWLVPTAGFHTATFVPGTSAHTWQAVAAGGMSIGTKGMIVAAKTLALTTIDLLTDSSTIEKARLELEKKKGKDFKYKPLLGDRDPPLDYRR
ncbi:amidohydrolase, partial [Candidatus Latescibacterota bacterium]